nr:hypothetical protein [Argonema antarcticum]
MSNTSPQEKQLKFLGSMNERSGDGMSKGKSKSSGHPGNNDDTTSKAIQPELDLTWTPEDRSSILSAVTNGAFSECCPFSLSSQRWPQKAQSMTVLAYVSDRTTDSPVRFVSS